MIVQVQLILQIYNMAYSLIKNSLVGIVLVSKDNALAFGGVCLAL